MRIGRASRKRAAALLLGLAATAAADDGVAPAAVPPPPGPQAAGETEPGTGPGVRNRVTLSIQLSGLGPNGCVLEIRPGHPGCRFPVQRFTVPGLSGNRRAKLDDIKLDVVSTGADRDCSFAITLREPNLPPRTYLRGLRLAEPTTEAPVPAKQLRCYLSTASLAARQTATSGDEARRR